MLSHYFFKGSSKLITQTTVSITELKEKYIEFLVIRFNLLKKVIQDLRVNLWLNEFNNNNYNSFIEIH